MFKQDPDIRTGRGRFESQGLFKMKKPPAKVVGNCRLQEEAVEGVGCIFLDPPRQSLGEKLIFLHGGAFTSGPVICHWGMLSRVCEKTGIPAVMVDYGLVPENPFPDGLNDVIGVYRALRREGSADRIYLMGDSSGGGLALSAVLALKDGKEKLPEKLGLLSPWLDLTLSHSEIENIRQYDQLLTREDLVEAGRVYADGHDPAYYLLSPINGDFIGIPPTLVLVGTHEIFLCDCRRFKEKAISAGAALTYQEWEGMFHDWMALTPAMREANQAVDVIVDFLNRPAGQPQAPAAS